MKKYSDTIVSNPQVKIGGCGYWARLSTVRLALNNKRIRKLFPNKVSHFFLLRCRTAYKSKIRYFVSCFIPSEIYRFLSLRGYHLTALTPLTSIFTLKTLVEPLEGK